MVLLLSCVQAGCRGARVQMFSDAEATAEAEEEEVLEPELTGIAGGPEADRHADDDVFSNSKLERILF